MITFPNYDYRGYDLDYVIEKLKEQKIPYREILIYKPVRFDTWEEGEFIKKYRKEYMVTHGYEVK